MESTCVGLGKEDGEGVEEEGGVEVFAGESEGEDGGGREDVRLVCDLLDELRRERVHGWWGVGW